MFAVCVSYFLWCYDKMPWQKQLKEGRFNLAHSSRVQSAMAWKSQWQEFEIDDDIVSVVMKKRAVSICIQFTFSFLYILSKVGMVPPQRWWVLTSFNLIKTLFHPGSFKSHQTDN